MGPGARKALVALNGKISAGLEGKKTNEGAGTSGRRRAEKESQGSLGPVWGVP